MHIQKAKEIIAANYGTEKNSLCWFLYEECVFSPAAFWEFYDAIACVTRHSVRCEELSAQIAIGYQRFLKELIYHFDPDDVAVMKDFPENYNEYLERLDFAVRAYYEEKPEWLDDARFDLQKPKG